MLFRPEVVEPPGGDQRQGGESGRYSEREREHDRHGEGDQSGRGDDSERDRATRDRLVQPASSPVAGGIDPVVRPADRQLPREHRGGEQ